VVIRGTVGLLLFVCFLSLSWADSTPENTIEEFYNIRKSFDAKHNLRVDSGAGDMRYKIILSELYKKTTTGELLKRLLAGMDQFSPSSCAGDYLFPEVPIKIASNKISLRTSTKAVVTYTVVVEKKWWSGELFPGEDDTQLRRIYKDYNIVRPKFKKVRNKLYNDKDDSRDIIVTAPGVITFYLDRTKSGWRIKKCVSKYAGSTLSWMTDPL